MRRRDLLSVAQRNSCYRKFIYTPKNLNDCNKAETVEEYLARGGEIKQCKGFEQDKLAFAKRTGFSAESLSL